MDAQERVINIIKGPTDIEVYAFEISAYSQAARN